MPDYKKLRLLLAKHFGTEQFLYYIETFGCRQNWSDTQRIAGVLEAVGFLPTQYKTKANIIVLNSCAVRETAEIKFIGKLRELKALKLVDKKKIIVACGCMFAEKYSVESIKTSYPFVDIVADTTFAEKLVGILTDFCEEGGKRFFTSCDVQKQIFEDIPVKYQDTFYASIPIMYGCDNFCSYCIVPSARGREVSRRPEAIISEIKLLLSRNVKRITLLGQNVNAYGKGLEPSIDFLGLLKQICAIDGEFIVDFLSSHPKFFTRDLIDFIADNPKMTKFIHLPLQSGSNDILSAMKRGYTAEEYLSLITYAKNKIDGFGITSDIIVGFPGETEVDFDATINLVQQIGFLSLFTFIFSKRPGTPAASLSDKIIPERKSDRMKRLLATQKLSGAMALSQFKDRRIIALVEEEDEEGNCVARAGNFLLIKFTRPRHMPTVLGQLKNIFITGGSATSLVGTLEEFTGDSSL